MYIPTNLAIPNLPVSYRNDARSIVIGDVEPFRSYEIKVQAMRDNVTSDWSSVTMVTTEESTPSAPTNFDVAAQVSGYFFGNGGRGSFGLDFDRDEEAAQMGEEILFLF